MIDRRSRSPSRASWNPLVCGDTSLPANRLLSAKLLALFLLAHLGPLWTPRIHLPFLRFLDHLGPAAPVLELGMTVALLCFAGTLLLNRIPRASCFALGFLVLLGILMDRTVYSNNKTFAGAFLLLLGLQEPDRPPLILRAQLVLVYFGAGLNKLLDPDWRGGIFFEFWTHAVLDHTLYMEVAELLPPLVLSKAMSWFVMFTEFGLALGFAMPGLVPWVIAFGILFHVGMLVFTGGEISWVFLYAMSAAFVAVARWPSTPLEVRYRGGIGLVLRRVLGSLDFENLYRWRRLTAPVSEAAGGAAERGIAGRTAGALKRIEVVEHGTGPGSSNVRSGPGAIFLLLAANPALYFPVAALLLWQPLPRFARKTLDLARRALYRLVP